MSAIIRAHAAAIAQIWDANKTMVPDNFRCRTVLDLVVQEGLDFTFKYCNKDFSIQRGPKKECYRNAGGIALFHSKRYLYCEGFAVISNELPLPVAHAWLWDTETQMPVEVTWETIGAEYLGIPFKTEWLRQFTIEREVWGVLDDPGFLLKTNKTENYMATAAELLGGDL